MQRYEGIEDLDLEFYKKEKRCNTNTLDSDFLLLLSVHTFSSDIHHQECPPHLLSAPQLEAL